MITLEALRSALLSEKPWSEMDRLVRAELASGRLTNQIYDELLAMVEDSRATPGFTEQSEEAFGDTLDRLSGFCAADSAYKNPPVLPTEEEIAKLPRWARVAFAARCARRVQRFHSGMPKNLGYTPTQAIELAESAAANGDVSPIAEEIILAVHAESQRPRTLASGQLVDQAIRAALSAARSTVPDGSESLHSFSAMLAAHGAILIDRWVHLVGNSAKANEILTTRNPGSKTPEVRNLEERIVPLFRQDFERVFDFSRQHEFVDSTRVPPEVFGPMWLAGLPEGWPVNTDTVGRADIALEVISRDGMDERIVEDEVVNLFNAINRYHISRGGSPLTVEDLQPLISALVLAGV